MKKQFLLILPLTLLLALNTYSQKLKNEEATRPESINRVFTTDNEELQIKWYEKFMNRMGLKGQTKDVYKAMVTYHSIKMELYDRADSPLSTNETRAALEKQLALLNEDVTPLLDDLQLKMHRKTWEKILKAAMSRIE